jgi:uncharacterized protein YbjT (DUF2867 family)
MKKALIAGATGLVGGQLLPMLLDSPKYSSVHSVGRRASGMQHDKLREWTVDFDALDQYAHKGLFEVEDVFCCLGTTMKKAGSRAAFRKVDHTYVVHLAEAALKNGATTFSVVSAMGADSASLFYYNRVKGDTEADLAALGFDRLHIFRPSLLLGDREEKRLGEEIAGMIMGVVRPLMRGSLSKYRPVHGRTVAAAIHAVAQQSGNGVRIFESDRIQQLGKEKDS